MTFEMLGEAWIFFCNFSVKCWFDHEAPNSTHLMIKTLSNRDTLGSSHRWMDIFRYVANQIKNDNDYFACINFLPATTPLLPSARNLSFATFFLPICNVANCLGCMMWREFRNVLEFCYQHDEFDFCFALNLIIKWRNRWMKPIRQKSPLKQIPKNHGWTVGSNKVLHDTLKITKYFKPFSQKRLIIRHRCNAWTVEDL